MDIQEKLKKKIGKKFIDYRRKWLLSAKIKILLDYPLHINFELNFGCNLSCEFCLHGVSYKKWNYKTDPKKNISLEKYCEIIDEGIKYGLCSIELNGINEPLLKKDICRYINYAKKSEILVISLHTNGLLLDKEKSEELINSGLDIVIFSVDATNKKVYEQIRKGSNYEKVIENINNFLDIKKELKYDFPLVKMSFAENNLNYNQWEEFKIIWKNKVNEVSSSFFCNPFIGKNNYKYIEDKYRLKDCDLGFCAEPHQRILIRNSGEVVPCCSFFGGEIIIGNIYEDSIYNIWNSNEMKEVRLFKLEACKKCKLSMLKDINGKN